MKIVVDGIEIETERPVENNEEKSEIQISIKKILTNEENREYTYLLSFIKF